MTRYIRPKRALFVHIPRTGGTWMQTAISKAFGEDAELWSKFGCPPWVARKHTPPQLFYRPLLGHVDFAFTVVREPVAWYSSVWRYLSRTEDLSWFQQRCGDWGPLNRMAALYSSSFDLWVLRVIDEEICPYTRLVELFCGPEGGETCGFIGRTETVVDDFFLAMAVLGHRVSEPVAAEIESMGVVQNRRGHPLPPFAVGTKAREQILRAERLVVRRFFGENAGRRLYAEMANEITTEIRRRMYAGRRPKFNREIERWRTSTEVPSRESPTCSAAG